jgi:hypothetical protein
MMKIILILISAFAIIFGIWHLIFSCIVGRVDTRSVTFLLSEDRIDTETLSNFKYTPWHAPSARIRPFAYGNKSLEGFKIVRYRRGFWPNWFIWRTYYEAEYLLPDGSKVIGPAFGPLPYSAPNLLVSIPVITAGIFILIIVIRKKSELRTTNIKQSNMVS